MQIFTSLPTRRIGIAANNGTVRVFSPDDESDMQQLELIRYQWVQSGNTEAVEKLDQEIVRLKK